MKGETRFRVPWVPAAAAAIALAAAAPAVAYVCHPDRPGTRALSLRGTVSIDSMRGAHVSLTVRRGGLCRRVGWDPSMGSSRTTSCATRRSSGGVGTYRASLEDGYLLIRRHGAFLRRIWLGYSPLPVRTATWRSRVFVLTSPAENGPARLWGFDVRTGRKTTDYPVPYSGASLDVAAGVAVFATTGRSGLYGLRLTDGTIALLGVERAHDNPQIERAGIVYRDNLYARVARAGMTTVKFVPLRAVRRSLAAVGHTLRAPGTIRSFSMDGPRVSLAVAGPGRSCDRILHWNIPWHYTSFITQPAQHEATCPNGRTRVARAGSVALGGLGSAWVLHGAHGQQLVRENSVACVERVLARGRIPLVAGDGSLIAYVRRTGGAWEVGSAGWRTTRPLVSSHVAVKALSVSGDGVAALRADGVVVIHSRWGSLLGTVRVPGARSISLDGGQLAVLSGSRTLSVFDAGTGRLEHSWRLPIGTRGPVDIRYGVAVVTKGRSVLGVRLATGRTVVLARAPRAVRAQIEGPGVAYTYNLGRHGFVGFVPLVQIERRVGLG